MLLSDQRVMQLLIQNGADVNAQDGDHLTPLHLASSRENTEIVQLLIEHGADVDALDRSYSKPVRTIGPLPADNRSPRTNTVAILSEQLKSLDPPGPAPLLSHYLTHSDRFGNVSSSGSATTTEFETSISEIFKMVERFRILVVGRSGVGKSSLINCAFGINDAIVFPDRPGKSDIEQEFVSPENQYLVLHDSQGFEPGDLSNFETVRTFIEQRSQQHLPLRDRIHGLWCVYFSWSLPLLL
ncbi:hypothetical protein EDB87DRAFT_1801741 [Lactarius vividus]|nr:hypothetical protein EDB87DRAFT_1801741 [Lactarius vividus]